MRIAWWATSALVDAMWLRMEEMTMERWLSAIRVGSRTLARSPVFTLMAVATLGLGIGATTTIFSLANWALFRPLPGVERPDELLAVTARPTDAPAAFAPISHPTAQRLMVGARVTAGVAAYSGFDADILLEEDDVPARVRARIVTPGFFEVLGVEPFRGRFFRAAEGGSVPAHTAIVSHDFWLDGLDRGEDLLGRTFEVNSTRFEIVGIAPPGFRGVNRTDQVRIWVPSSAMGAARPRLPSNVLEMETAPVWWQMVVRRAEGATVDAVEEQLQALAPELEQGDLRLDAAEGFGIPEGLRARISDTLTVVAGLVALLLILTVANLVNLVLSRVARRRHEAVLRKALGASSLGLTGTLAVEGILLGLLGTGAALLVGLGLLKVLDGATLLSWMPTIQGVPFDYRVFAFALATTVGATLLASVSAALGIQKLPAGDALRSSRSVTGSGRRYRRAIVSLQVALSLALVVGAALLVKSLTRLQGPALGLETEGVATLSLSPGVQGYTALDADRLFRELGPALEAHPEITSTSFVWQGPFSTARYAERVARSGQESPDDVLSVEANMVSPGFFDDLGIALLEGRSFDDREYRQTDRPDVGAVVINRSLAERLFPDAPAVGREVVMPGRHEAAFEVLGIVEDARLSDPRAEAEPMLFDPFGNGYRTTRATFVLRGSAPPEAMIDRAREVMRELDPRIPVLEAGALDDAVAARLVEERALVRIASVFAALGLLLAAAGLFGLMTETVHARIREFGVRTALGASPAGIMRLVLGDTVFMVGVGAVPGLVLGYLVGSLLEARLAPEVGPSDLTAFALATAVLLGVALLASLQPALRSGRVDPVRALRAE